MSRLIARPKLLLAAIAAASLSFIPPAPNAGSSSKRSAAGGPQVLVSDGPLRVTAVSLEKRPRGPANAGGDFSQCTYRVSVENVSGKVVRGYALRSQTVEGPPSVGVVYPDADRQTLRPGESKAEVMTHVLPETANVENLSVTVGHVNFDDGTTWGPDQE